MRNLKKILALVLALVMSLSLMATAGASSFSDVEAGNQYETAIDVLDALKVFIGYTDGSFQPNGELTRAEAAVLVYRIATGDVEGKYVDNYTYMNNNQFKDLDGYNWAKGYINYCQNAGIVVGTSKDTFSPGNKVTGYQLMVMVLRTLGYGKAGEFTGATTWELETASKCESLGMLKNVTEGDFGQPAKRAMVAEVLFRGLLQPTVKYSALTPGGYTPDAATLGKQTLNLDDIEGVVVANHIADLYDTEPTAEGQTRMIVDGADYVIDMDTDATAIGLNHHAYVQNGKVLAGLEATGNTIGEPEVPGAASKVADLAKAAGIKTNSATEYYLNFADTTKSASTYKIKYVLVFDSETEALAAQTRINDASGLKSGDGYATLSQDDHDLWTVVTRIIPPKTTITSVDLSMMRTIFGERDRWTNEKGTFTDGAVYVGSQSIYDISDVSGENVHYWSFDSFVDEFINETQDAITSSDNGEWLRVIDNNGDGVVDYVLRTDFVMTTITDYEKRTETYNVEWKGGLPNGDGNGKIPASDIVKATEDTDLSVGSVILYTLIDGKYYVSNPDVTTLTVDKKSINSKAGTFTSNDTTYTWSGIDEKAERYYDSVSQLAYETKYDMYPDHFGFIRLATETTRNFVLLTDGYYSTDNRTSVYKADLYDGTNAVYDAEVNDHGYRKLLDEGFIDTYENDHLGNRSTWLRLNTFGEYYTRINVDDPDNITTYWWHYVDKTLNAFNGSDSYDGTYNNKDAVYYKDPFYTNIALGSENDGKWTLEDVENLDEQYNGLYRDYTTYELTGDIGFKATDLWGVKSWNANNVSEKQPIQTNGRTLYYYVENPGAHGEDLKVQSWTGYQSFPEALEKAVAKKAYAVTHVVVGSTVDYVIADVVVFEGVPTKTAQNPQLIINGITSKREIALGRDDEGTYTEHDTAFGLFSASQLKTVNGVDNSVLPYATIVPYDRDGLVGPQVTFFDPNYDTDKGSDAEHTADGYIKSNFAKYGIIAGVVTVVDETKEGDYVEITPTGTAMDTRRLKFLTDEIAVYELDQITAHNGNATKNLDAIERENIKYGDQVIVMCDADGAVQLVVNVDRSSVNGTPYRDGKGNYDDANAIKKLLDLYQYVLIDQGAQAGNSKTAAQKIEEAAALLDKDDVASGEMLEAWELLSSITDEEIQSLTVAQNSTYESLMEVLGEDGVEVINTLLAEEAADILGALQEYAADAILEVIGDSWEDVPNDVLVEKPEGSGNYYIDIDGLFAHDFNNDASLTEEQAAAIAEIIEAYEAAETAAEDIDVSEFGADDYDEAITAIHEALVEIDTGTKEEIDEITDELVNGPSEVEDAGTVVAVGKPAGVEFNKDDDSSAPEEYDNVVSAYEVVIPSTYDSTNVQFDIAVPEGQTPYVDEETLPSGVTSVDFTPKAAQTQSVSAKIWEVEITLTAEPEEEVKIPVLFLDEGDEPIPVPSTIIDMMSLNAKDLYSALSGATYNSWEFGKEMSAVGLDSWLTSADGFTVDETTNTITFTGTAKAIDPTDITYKSSEIGTNTSDYIPWFGYKDYAYYCVVGKYDGEALKGKGGLAEDGSNFVEGYFELDESKVAEFGTKYALLAIGDTEAGWTRFLIVGNFEEEFTITINDVEWTINLDLEWK